MKLTYKILEDISNAQGDSYYMLDSKQFQKNYDELLNAFRMIYPNTHIAYSYKTNYIPKLCKIVNDNGGFAEVVSDMEYKVALKIGVKAKDIYFNGPYKDPEIVEELLLNGGIVNIDSVYEFDRIQGIAKKHPERNLFVGLRCNFDIHDGVTSRFGFDVHAEEFSCIVNKINETSNLHLIGLHCHFASRYLDTWPNKVAGMLRLVEKYFKEPPEFISVGGGLFGKMDDSLKMQFERQIPDYGDYAAVVATCFRDAFKYVDPSNRPKLIIEPGTALVGDSMKFVTKVINIKEIRGKKIATTAGSIFNINPTLNGKNPPITIYRDNNINETQLYENLDFSGYTCIESDYLYRGFNGELAVGDYIVFDNIGSYSIVLKPPFILPNSSVVDYDDETNLVELVKRRESFEDVFQTYVF